MNPAHTSPKTGSRYRVPIRRGHRVVLQRHNKSPDPGDLNAVSSWLETRPRPWAIDLFCGAGGLSLGLEDGGFSVVAAADSDPLAIETHAANIEGLTWTGDLSEPTAFITQLDVWGIDSIDLLAGGPPCQPFSQAGTAKIGDLVRGGSRRADDERADLWRSFFAITDHLKPRAVLFENVQGFTTAQDGAVLVALVDELKRREYAVDARVIEAWRHRVPQHRSRLFVVGTAPGVQFEWPKSSTWRPTVWQAIADLPVVPADTRDEVQVYEGPPSTVLGRMLRRGLRGGESHFIRDHVTRSVRPDDAEIYRLLRPGDTYLDVPEHLKRYRSDTFDDKYFRLSYDDLSRTITAHIAKDGYWYIHPEEDRTLSVREAARIQTFPDRVRFAGHPSNRYRQIGNAVPPLLASAMAASVRRALDGESEAVARDGTDEPSAGTYGFRDDLIRWFRRTDRRLPWRERGLNPWQVLLIEMCLHRTRADQVAQVAEEILSYGRTPAQFIENADRLASSLATLGLRWRLENLVSAAKFVRDDLVGCIPDSWQRLATIPGVGDYIASAVLCFAFDQSVVLMDTNTRRIARRVLGEAPNLASWRLRLGLRELAGAEGANAEWNMGLLDLGGLVCTAHAPKCTECPVRSHCATGRGTEDRTLQHGLR